MNKDGEIIERYFHQLFLKKGYKVDKISDILPRDRWNEFDLLVQKEDYYKTYEIKNDIMSQQYGNIAIEYAQGKKEKKPSGILVSKSDYWIHCVYGWNHYFIVETPRLRYWFMEMLIKNDGFRIHEEGGDNGNSLMLVKISELQNQIKNWGNLCKVHPLPDIAIQKFSLAIS